MSASMTPPRSTRFDHLTRSPTVAMLDTVSSLRESGVDVIDLSGGEPDFVTPEHIRVAATTAINDGFTHYTPSRGTAELREAISEKFRDDNALIMDPNSDVIVTPSAKHALFIAMMTVLEPGDEIIIPDPAWPSYAMMARLAGASTSRAQLRSDHGFRWTREALEAARTDRSRALLVNTPNNPTGRVVDTAELNTIADFADDHDLHVISDEIYEKVIFPGSVHRSVAAHPRCTHRTITVNGFSKGYAMTGWRLGYLAGPADAMSKALRIQEHTVSCASSFIQSGGVAALTGDQRPVVEMTASYRRRRDSLVGRLRSMPGITCSEPEGAFYVLPNIAGTGFADAIAFSDWLLRETGVCVTAGNAFGSSVRDHVRISFANSENAIDIATDRLENALRARST